MAVGKVVGKSGPGKWGQVHDFLPDEEEKRVSHGRLIAAIGVNTGGEEGQMDMVALGREVLSRLHEQYFGNNTGSARERLELAVSSVISEFHKTEIAAIAVFSEEIVVVAMGGAGVFVSTSAGAEGWLVKVGEAGLKSFSSKGVSGKVLVMGTRGFWLNLSEAGVSGLVKKMESGFSEAIEMLVSEEQAGDEQEGGAGVVIKIQITNSKIQIEEEEPNEDTLSKKNKFGEAWIGWMKQIAGKIYVQRGDKQQQRKKMLFAGIGFMAILLILFGGGKIMNAKREQTNISSSAEIEKMAFDFDEAKAMSTLNPSRSRQLLTEIKTSLENVNPKIKDDRLGQMRSEWQGVWNKASGVVETTPEEVIKLGFLREGLTGSGMRIRDGTLVILDSSGGRLIEVVPKTGAGKITASGEEIKGARLLATYPGKTIVTAANSMWQIVGDKKTQVIKDDEKINDGIAIAMWSGNIYLLGPSMIWRYQAAGDGFAAAKEWLADGESSKLGNPKGITIDGSVWVVTREGITKFVRGVSETLEPSGFEEKWGEGVTIYTNEDAQNLYISEKDQKRIWTVGKNGEYLKQYKSEIFGTAIDLVVDEKDGTGYILTGDAVWKFGL